MTVKTYTRKELDNLIGKTLYHVDIYYDYIPQSIHDFYTTFICKSWRGKLDKCGNIINVTLFSKENYEGVIGYTKWYDSQ